MRETLSPAVRRLALLLVSLLLALLVGEALLRALGTLRTYPERNFGAYQPFLGRSLPEWGHARPPLSEVEFRTTEFDFTGRTNREGLRDVEHDAANPQRRLRLVVLGDSYVEGVGARCEEAWPRVLERILGERGFPVEVIAGGVSGSDPCFAFRLLERRLAAYGPRLVVLAINSSDVSDVVAWGGMERFRADGTVRGRPAPRFEALYRHSHLVRLVVHRFLGYDSRLVPAPRRAEADWRAQQAILEAIDRFLELGREVGFELVVVEHPTPQEVVEPSSAFFQFFFVELEARGVACLRLGPRLRAALAGLELERFAWPIDRHYNALGYAVLAEQLAEALLEAGLLPEPERPR